jgi:hypothetical protein
MNNLPAIGRSSANTASPVRAPWSLAWLGALSGLGLALLVWAPARWLAWGVAQASQGQVQWLNPRGTVWQGSAQLLLSGGPGSRQPRQMKDGPLHEDSTGLLGGMLIQGDDVGTRFGQEAGDRGDQAGPVRATHQQAADVLDRQRRLPRRELAPAARGGHHCPAFPKSVLSLIRAVMP